MSSGVIPSPVYSVDAIEDKTQISRQRFSGGQKRLSFYAEKTAQEAESLQGKALDTGRISYRQFRILQEKRRRMPTAHAAQPAETENVPLAQSADRREISKRQRFRQRALDKREIKTPDSYLRFFL